MTRKVFFLIKTHILYNNYIYFFFTGFDVIEDVQKIIEQVVLIQSLDIVAHSKSILNDIRELWIRESPVGFHFFKSYDPEDVRCSLSHLALMMVNIGPAFDLIQHLFWFTSQFGNLMNQHLWRQRIWYHQSRLMNGICSLIHHINFDQNMLKRAISMLIHLYGNDLIIFSYTSMWLRSKLNSHNLFTTKISAYISDVCVCKLVRRCKRYFTSSADILKHLLGINTILNRYCQ